LATIIGDDRQRETHSTAGASGKVDDLKSRRY
jgi:hypothetical protein